MTRFKVVPPPPPSPPSLPAAGEVSPPLGGAGSAGPLGPVAPVGPVGPVSPELVPSLGVDGSAGTAAGPDADMSGSPAARTGPSRREEECSAAGTATE